MNKEAIAQLKPNRTSIKKPLSVVEGPVFLAMYIHSMYVVDVLNITILS